MVGSKTEPTLLATIISGPAKMFRDKDATGIIEKLIIGVQVNQ